MMIWKSLFRTIRKSMGRYLAILSIIALGVGFFAGLRVTQKAMIKTADSYISELELYDFRLISTLGFTEDDVNAFREAKGIKAAEGSVSSDFIYVTDSGSDSVLHAHSLMQNINGLDVISGRLPENADECILDAKYTDESKIGTYIVLSQNNPDNIIDTFAYDKYKVVGIANASAYINFERGTTSLANGSVSGFVYIPAEGFNTDYYTEIYITIPRDGEIYSDEYNDCIENAKGTVEELLAERADIRFEKIYSDAKSEIDDAKAELEENINELDSAQKEIDDGWALYNSKREEAEKLFADTEASLKSARSELDAARAALDAAWADPSSANEQVKAALEAAEKELAGKEAMYAKSVEAYQNAVADANKEFADTEQKLSDSQAELDDAREKINDAQSEIADAENELEKLEPAITYVLERSSNIGYASFENDTSIVSGVAKVFPLFFFLVAALVCITTMTRMVSEQRTENGILKALGYNSSAIAGQYLFYAGSASVIGCVIGFFIGSKFLPMALWQVYNIMYSIARPIEFVLDWQLFALCSLLYLFCALGATWLVCYRDLSESSAELIRPKAPAAGKRILLEHINFIWKHIKFLHKVSIRNILRYKKRMFMMIIGIGGCTALLIAGFGISDSIKPVIDNQYNEIELYDASVSFMDSMDEYDRNKFVEEIGDAAESVLFLHTENSDIITKNGSKQIKAVVFTQEPVDFISLHSKKEAIPFPKKGEAVINYRFASENGISKGDTIELIGDDYRKVSVVISGIFDNYVYDYIYVCAETYEEQLSYTPECNAAYVNFPDGKDAKSAGAAILSADGVANVSLIDDMKARVDSMLESIDYIVLIVLVCAGALAFIVLYNLTNITITERTREIATLKVLGFYQREQHYYVFRENIVLTAISALCGIPMGIALLYYVMAQIKISTIYFGCHIEILSYVFAILITFLFTIIVDLTLTSKTKRINMAEAMKAIE